MIDPAARQQLVSMLRTLSFERRQVVLSSGRVSDFFIDCKQTALTAEGHVLLGELMFAALDDLPPADAVAGVELGGCPLASAVSFTSFLKGRPLPALYVRKSRKDHGSQRLIEGDRSVRSAMRVAILEDVITTGASTLQCARALQECALTPCGVVAIVDRMEGGRETIEQAGLRVIALTTRRDFIVD